MKREEEYNFRPAVLEEVGLFIGLAGGTGSGKTMSAMRMAQGIVGRDKKFAVIDTESRRSRHYAPRPGKQPDFIASFNFDAIDLDEPYSSERYEGMVRAAIRAGYRAIVLDSGSHEHDGIGGYLDAQAVDLEERVERQMKKYPNSNEYDVRERLTPSSWIKPKRARKRMMQTFLAASSTIPIIFCFRAEEKTFKSQIDANGKPKLVAMNPPVWEPVCGKGMPFEMTVFFMLHREKPGVPVPIKLEGQHKPLFKLDHPLDEEAGRRIAAWAHGKDLDGAPRSQPVIADAETRLQPGNATEQLGQDYISVNEAIDLETLCRDNSIPVDALKKAAGVEQVALIKKADLARAHSWINAAVERRARQNA